MENKKCPLCGSEAETWIPYRSEVCRCSNNDCELHVDWISIAVWNTRPRERQLQTEIDRLQSENALLLEALISMTEQYLTEKDGTLFHYFMNAGEVTLDLLDRLGYVKEGPRCEYYEWTGKGIEVRDRE